MKLLVEHLKNLRELYVNQLQMLLSAERQFAISLQTMIERTADGELREVFLSHKGETETHAARLSHILTDATGDADLVKCKAAQGLAADCDDMFKDARNDIVRDVALVTAAERIEHFEIASYRAVHKFAQILGDAAAAELLAQTMSEERNAARRLEDISIRLDIAAEHPIRETQPQPLSGI